MNILLTQKCVRSCPYCFAKRHMTESAPDDILSWENLIYLADFLQASGRRYVSLLGGEPSLHPDFSNFLLYLRERGFQVSVFTSGLMSERTFNNLRAVLCKDMNDEGKDGIGFTCNINDPKDSPAAEYNKVMEFLKEYGKLVTPGFNIYRPDFDLGFLCDLIERYKLKRHIRLGLAHPGVGIESTVIDGSRMARMAERLIEQLPMLERHKIEAGPDCGFPMCAFTDEQLGKLLKTCGWHAKFDCSPAIDVGPDMNVWACFPISSIEKRSIFEFATMEVLMEHFKSEHKKVRTESGGIFERCGVCQYLDRVCMGGCLSHGLNRAAGKPLELAVAAA